MESWEFSSKRFSLKVLLEGKVVKSVTVELMVLVGQAKIV